MVLGSVIGRRKNSIETTSTTRVLRKREDVAIFSHAWIHKTIFRQIAVCREKYVWFQPELFISRTIAVFCTSPLRFDKNSVVAAGYTNKYDGISMNIRSLLLMMNEFASEKFDIFPFVVYDDQSNEVFSMRHVSVVTIALQSQSSPDIRDWNPNVTIPCLALHPRKNRTYSIHWTS